jgi:hypothetical protein
MPDDAMHTRLCAAISRHAETLLKGQARRARRP